ncbi:hypothetical protein [Flagellimonas sp.]|uniref:hypothetical protein n=1 Tax=Flagellimonas sp. TaxID=2058762 RepID=UPI003F4A05AC
MKIAADTVSTILSGHTPLQDEIEGRAYWEVGKRGGKGPSVIFRVQENIPTSKTNRDFIIKLYCFAKSITKAAEISELVKDAFELNTLVNSYYQGGTSGFNEEDDKEAFVEVNINFKLR